jgi:hypothetical protein
MKVPNSDPLQKWETLYDGMRALSRFGTLEAPSLVPTAHELVLLLRHWTHEASRIEYGWFLFYAHPASSDETTMYDHAQDRIYRIAKALEAAGIEKQDVKAIIEDARDEFGKTVDAEAWQVFRHGSLNDQIAFVEKCWKEEAALQKAKNGRETH